MGVAASESGQKSKAKTCKRCLIGGAKDWRRAMEWKDGFRDAVNKGYEW